MQIAVYSGSFDPLHIGHQAIMEHLTRDGGFDWVYLVVSPQNPFKDPSKAESALRRYRNAVDAVKRHPDLHVWVDDIELGMEPPHYTIRTLLALKEREPENDFTLVIGADNLAVFRGWRDYGRILKEFGIIVFPREGFDMVALKDSLLAEDTAYRISLADAAEVDVSSTEIRDGEERGVDMSAFKM